MKTKELQKVTETGSNINKILSLERITPKDLEQLSKAERSDLIAILTEKFYQLKGTEQDDFYKKFESIIGETTKNKLWERNHILITSAISALMQEYGRMPTKTEIALKTELSRQTIHKHFREYANHPQYLEQIEQFKFMTTKVLAMVYRFALKGDMRAAKLYFSVVGAINRQNNTMIRNQNNYIQINGMVLSQEAVKHLSEEQLKTIETILKTALPQPEFLEIDTPKH